MEILAPAGNRESLLAAVNSGADAVYFGLSDFNARKMAENFSFENLNETVEFCHLHNVKCYLALNTLIKNTEIETAVNFVSRAVSAKIDAFIVADLGLAYILKNKFSGIVLHASTQAGVHNLLGAVEAEKLGFKRVILSRETALSDIIDIKKNTNLEIEYFVQGALCVAFSGACLLSDHRCGKSGNRGECTQPCRLNYKLNSGDKTINAGKLLSTRDLCLINNLKTLVNAGVTSFKIEGRNRRPAYVGVATEAYKSAIQNTDIKNSILELKKVFNRGDFNENAYLNGEKNNIINPQVSSHKGVLIGNVKYVEKFKDIYKIKIDSRHNFVTGDGIKFFDKDIEKASAGVGNVLSDNNLQIIFSTYKPKVGYDVYLTLDQKFETDKLSKVKKLQVDIYAEFFAGKLGSVKANFKDISVLVKTENILTAANKLPLDKDNLINAFSKNKDTVFTINSVQLKTDNVFVPLSVLNNLKNLVYSNLKTKILENFYSKNLITVKEKNIDLSLLKNNFTTSFTNTIIITKETDKLKKEDDNNNYYAFDGDIGSFKAFYKQTVTCLGAKLCGFVLPVFATGEDVKFIEKIMSAYDKNTIFLIANNIYGLAFARQNYIVIGGVTLNVFNDYSAAYVTYCGVKNYTVAPELKSQIKEVTGGYEAEGYLTLMTLAHCPFLVAGGNCEKCKYAKDAFLESDDNVKLKIHRQKILQCTFQLKPEKYIAGYTNKPKIIFKE